MMAFPGFLHVLRKIGRGKKFICKWGIVGVIFQSKNKEHEH